MSLPMSLSTRRRGFLATIAAGAGTLATGLWSRADAEVPFGSAAEEPWVTKIHGKYRQVFDAVSANEGFGVAFALNFIKSTKAANPGVTDADINPVVVMRHFSMPLALTDAVWAKYKIGELLGIKDKSGAPATRNIFHNAIPLYDGMTYQSVIATQGVTIVACNMALTVISGMAAPKAGVSADEAKKEWTAGLIPGVQLSASGVYAVNRAQNAGGCTYCFAG